MRFALKKPNYKLARPYTNKEALSRLMNVRKSWRRFKRTMIAIVKAVFEVFFG